MYQTQAASDARYVNASGDTMGALNVNGGNLTVNSTSEAAHRYLYLNTGATNDGHIVFQRGGTTKFQISADANGHLFTWNYAKNGTSFRVNTDGSVITPHQPNFIFQGSYNGWTTINQSGQWLPFTGSTGVATSTNYEIPMNWTSSRTGGYNLSGNGINANTGVYTAPVNGTYMFTFQTYMLKGAAGSGYLHINSFINGSNQDDYTIYGYGLSAGVYVQPEITKVIRMSANDTFGFRLYTNVNDYKIYPHYTCLTGYLLG